MNELYENPIILTVAEFQKKVIDGEITDDKGMAIVLLNGEPSSLNVYIDKRCATKPDGSLITYAGFVKQYKNSTVEILYTPKKQKLLSLDEYYSLKKQ